MQSVRLRCEGRREPLGVDARAPRLSWELRSRERGQRQSAYQILAGGAPGASDLWDTGRVSSSESIGIVWEGRRLSSGQRVHWQVRVWDRDGQGSAWSRPSFFEMGLLEERDWGGARWIRDPRKGPKNPYDDDPVPLFAKELTLPRAVKSARLYITGLGYFEASINGKNVSDAVLEPGWTNYSKRVFYPERGAGRLRGSRRAGAAGRR